MADWPEQTESRRTVYQAAMSEPEVSWSALDGFAVVIGAFVVYFVGSAVLVEIGHITKRYMPFWFIPASYLFLTVGAFGLTFGWLVLRRGASWRMIGFRLPATGSAARSLGWIVLVAVVAYVITIYGSNVIVALFSHTGFHIKGNAKELLPPKQKTVTLAQFLILLGVGSMLAPITEETLFRGALYQGIRRTGSAAGRATGIAIAAITAGTIFGAFHLLGSLSEIYTLPILAFLGIVLCLTFQVTGSLAGSMLLHATVNGVSIVLVYGALIR